MRRKWWRVFDCLKEFSLVATVIEPIADVTVEWQVWEQDDFGEQAGGIALSADVACVCLTGRIVVGENSDTLDTGGDELFRVLVCPFARAATVGGGSDVETPETVSIFFAFDDTRHVPTL